MPYSDGRDRMEYENTAKIEQLTKEVALWEGVFCALMNQLVTSDFRLNVIHAAEDSGKVKIMSLWENHKKKDFDRLSQVLSKFSEDEISIIKKILNI